MRWLVLVVAAIVSMRAAAWNDAGHLIAAFAAYDVLPSAARTRLDTIVRAHPRFRADFEARRPRGLDGADTAVLERWYFAFASTWPDLARHFGHVASRPERERLIDLYHRGRWHYVNLPTYLAPGDARALADRGDALEGAGEAGGDGDGHSLDIVRALGRLVHMWRAPETTDAERAIALAWLGHLVADLHQPLHATALFAIDVFPEGDRGGNLLSIVPDGNLHALWDGALGSSTRRRNLDTLLARLPAAGAVADAFDFAAWAGESQRIAECQVYSTSIRTAIEARRGADSPVTVTVDAGYLEAMRQRSAHQIARAGARLAALLAALASEAPQPDDGLH